MTVTMTFPDTDHPAPDFTDIYCFKLNGKFRHTPEADTQPDDTDTYKSNRVLCALCANPITETSQKILVHNKHIHQKINPQGYIFSIGCYRHAPGCISNGNQSDFFSWFSGYSWQHQVCGECRSPMGWCFRSGHDMFYGLIIDNIIEEEI